MILVVGVSNKRGSISFICCWNWVRLWGLIIFVFFPLTSPTPDPAGLTSAETPLAWLTRPPWAVPAFLFPLRPQSFMKKLLSLYSGSRRCPETSTDRSPSRPYHEPSGGCLHCPALDVDGRGHPVMGGRAGPWNQEACQGSSLLSPGPAPESPEGCLGPPRGGRRSPLDAYCPS